MIVNKHFIANALNKILERCELVNVTKSKEEFIDGFVQQLQGLIPHSFTAKQQSAFLRTKKEDLKDGEFVVVGDFSENYSFVIQAAPGAEYFSKSQCTIHPFCIYYKQNGELKNKSLIIISEEKDHFFPQVYLFKRKLIEYMRNKFGQINKIFFFSDGAAQQYKNRKNFFDLCQMKKEGTETEWHFFATAHGKQIKLILIAVCRSRQSNDFYFSLRKGKGPCDAIGGTFKRNAMRASIQRLDCNQIRTPLELFTWATSKQSDNDYIFCAKSEHNAVKLPSSYQKLRQVDDTRKQHSFKPINDKCVEYRMFSFSPDFQQAVLQ